MNSPLVILFALVFLAVAAFFAVRWTSAEESVAPPVVNKPNSEPKATMPAKTYAKPSDAELAKKLTPMQLYVTQRDGTEPPFENEFWNNKEAGLYVDVASGEPLFSSRDKFDSGTGWPSFTKPVEENRIASKRDMKLGMERIEARSKTGDSHLGHVFPDGPAPTGMRYCINSASLRFIPLSKLEAEGYGEYRGVVEGTSNTVASATNNVCAIPKDGDPNCVATAETAVLGGGCFWGMEEILRKIPGVISTDVGYCGGKTENPTYKQICSGNTGHAEVVKIVFDKSKLSYADLLEKWFFKMHDPTTLNRQHNDIGTQYRSAIFTTSDEQAKIAKEVIERVNKSGKWKKPVVTEVAKLGKFTLGEDYHQEYLVKNPGGYNCHFLRE